MPTALGILPGDKLSADRISQLLSTKRNRGGHETYVADFIKSGEMIAVVNTNIFYKDKTKEQLTTSVTQGLNKAAGKYKTANSDSPAIKVMYDDDTDQLLIVNMDKYVASLEAAEDEDAGDES